MQLGKPGFLPNLEDDMKLTQAGRRMAAVLLAALAAMLLCFAARRANTALLPALPRTPPAAPAGPEGLVDVNAAGLEELTALPGIGPARAQAILDDRAANGPFRYPEDLIRVKGIGEGVLSGILDQITTGG